MIRSARAKRSGSSFFDILVLHVAFGMFQGWIDLAFAAQVNDLEIFQKFRKDFTDRTVDGNGSQAASDDQNDRFFRGEAAEFQSLKLIAGEQLPGGSEFRSEPPCPPADSPRFPENYSRLLRRPECTACWPRPGVISDSWMIAGILRRFAAITTGTVTKPPLEKTISGFSCFSSLLASEKPFSTRKRVGKVFRVEVAGAAFRKRCRSKEFLNLQ